MTETFEDGGDGYLTGQLLVAMPAMTDPRFERTVIYMCVHNEDGAVGLVVNKLVDALTFDDLLSQLDIDVDAEGEAYLPDVHFGGPVETGRGFVLHSADYMKDDSLQINDRYALTSTVDIVRDIAAGEGPSSSLLALGYAGWGAGQLDDEIQENAWLSVSPDQALIFDTQHDTKWNRAMSKLGIDVSLLSSQAGRA